MFVNFEHDDIEVLQAVYENNWKNLLLPESNNKSNLFWAATANHCYTITTNPIESDWRKEVPIFCLKGILRRPGQGLHYCKQQPVTVHRTLTARCSHGSFPEKTLEKAPVAHCLKARRKTCKQPSRFLRHFFLSSWKMEYTRKDRLLITQRKPNYGNRKNSRLINLDHSKSQEALTPVVLN